MLNEVSSQGQRDTASMVLRERRSFVEVVERASGVELDRGPTTAELGRRDRS
jgi:hypothetical protein